MGQHGITTTNRRCVLRVVVLSLCTSFLVELGTLVGAPLSSPFVLSDWSLWRSGIVFLISLPFWAYLCTRTWHNSWQRLCNACTANDYQQLKRLARWAIIVCVGAISTLVATACVCTTVGQTNMLPYQLTFATFVSTVLILVAMRRSIPQHPERGYLVIVLAAGLLLCVLTPHYTHISWDDHIHFDRATSLSYLFDPQYTAPDRAQIEREFHDVEQYSRSSDASERTIPFEKTSLDAVRDRLGQLGASEMSARLQGPTTLRGVGTVECYAIAYLPMAVGLWLGRLLQLAPGIAFVLGRCANLLCYALITYAAVKRLKSGKMLLTACALIPTLVFLASSYSYDGWLVAFLMLAFAFFIGELQRPDELLSWKRFWIIIAAFLLGFAPKAIYVPLAVMLFFMPRSKFVRKDKTTQNEASNVGTCEAKVRETEVCKDRARKAGARKVGELTHARFLVITTLAGLLVLATFVLPFLVAGPGAGDARGGAVDPAWQMSFIIEKPLGYASILLNFLPWYIWPGQTPYVFSDFCGLETGSLTVVVALLLLVTALTDRTDCDLAYATHGKRFAIAALCLLVICLIATSMFICFTPAGTQTIAGVQGRYLLPMVFPSLMLLMNFTPLVRRMARVKPIWYNMTILSLCGSVLFLTMWEVLLGRFC